MPRKLLLVLLILLGLSPCRAQRNGMIRGLAFDSISRQAVPAATITLLKKKDSALVSFTMTGSDGKFQLNNIADGEYRLLITHVNYHNYSRNFTISDSNRVVELGNIFLFDKTKVLQGVTVTNEAPPVTLINDTVQYNAGSFKTPPNASVEQLLKKLPGVQVQKDGSIKAQGENVKRVLVDGKEFFGNDPKVATKNLPADAVDKVQVYDKQSDQAQLTGIDDGNYEKTINLKLKADKKRGLFGKVNAGAGTDNRYEGKFNVNSFKGARQMSVIGMGNNTNAEGFTFMDMLNFTGELARMQRGGGNININISGDDAASMGIYGGNRNSGINTAWAGGINYNNIIGKKLDWQSNYFYNHYNPKTESSVQRQYFLPDSSYFYNYNAHTDNINDNHRLNFNVLWQIDTFNSIHFTPSLGFQQTNTRSYTDYETLTSENKLVNSGFSDNSSSNSGHTFRDEMVWRKKFPKRGRTFSLSFQNSNNASSGDGSLFSVNQFYDTNGGLLHRDTLNQQYKTTNHLDGYLAKAVYTEPLSKRSLLELSLGKSFTRNTSQKNTQDFNNFSGKYDLFNRGLSNDFEDTYSYFTPGVRIRSQKKKFNYAFGAYWQQSELNGKIFTGSKDSLIGKTFQNLLPTARVQYNFTRFKTLYLSYAASVNQPTVQQLQPVPDNSNPLKIKTGNPDLKQEYDHTLQGRLMLISPYKNKELFLFLNLQAVKNKISNADSITNAGITWSRPVNVNGTYNFTSDVEYNIPTHFIKGNFGTSFRASFNRSKQLVNSTPNNIKTFSWGPEIRFDLNPTENLNINLNASLNRVHSSYSLQPSLSAGYLTQDYEVSADWQMPKQFFLGSDFTYTINSRRADGYNLKVPLWNASLSKMFLKYNRGEIKCSVRDILNQNIGISRNTNNNYIEDARVLTLRRFFLLSFTYSLSKTGLNNAGNGGMRVIMK